MKNNHCISTLTKDILDEKGIKWMYHFTRAENLESILQFGLLSKDDLEEKQIKVQVNDKNRFDGCTDFVSLSIGFPNYKMFYHLREMDHNIDWVVLSLKAESILCNPNLECAYCWTNAANSAITTCRLEERMSIDAFYGMFDNHFDFPKRETIKGMKSYYPTDPQAEVLVRGRIPAESIGLIYFKDNDIMQKYKAVISQGGKAQVDAKFFSCRSDCN